MVSILLFFPLKQGINTAAAAKLFFECQRSIITIVNTVHINKYSHPAYVYKLLHHRLLASRTVQLLAMLAPNLSLALGPFFFFVSALIVISAGYVVYQYFFSPIAAFPGPFAAKFTKIWRAYATYRGQWHREIIELHRRYGNVVRIGPNEL